MHRFAVVVNQTIKVPTAAPGTRRSSPCSERVPGGDDDVMTSARASEPISVQDLQPTRVQRRAYLLGVLRHGVAGPRLLAQQRDVRRRRVLPVAARVELWAARQTVFGRVVKNTGFKLYNLNSLNGFVTNTTYFGI